jgi:hypothetical protein
MCCHGSHIMNERKALFTGNVVDCWAYSGDAGFQSPLEKRLSVLTFLVVFLRPFRCNTVSSRSLPSKSSLIYHSRSSSIGLYKLRGTDGSLKKRQRKSVSETSGELSVAAIWGCHCRRGKDCMYWIFLITCICHPELHFTDH